MRPAPAGRGRLRKHFFCNPRLLFVDYCWSLRLNEPGEVCPSLCEMRNFSPGQKHILGRGFCLAVHDAFRVLRLNTEDYLSNFDPHLRGLRRPGADLRAEGIPAAIGATIPRRCSIG